MEPLARTLSLITPLSPSTTISEKNFTMLHSLVLRYFPRFIAIEKRHFQWDLRTRSWDAIARTFYGFLVMLGTDYALKRLNLPPLVKHQFAMIAPFLFSFPIINADSESPLFKEMAELKHEIMSNLTKEEEKHLQGFAISFTEPLEKLGVKP
jgi:hypothetical protein